jgi:hypothetical protein
MKNTPPVDYSAAKKVLDELLNSDLPDIDLTNLEKTFTELLKAVASIAIKSAANSLEESKNEINDYDVGIIKARENLLNLSKNLSEYNG